MLFNRPRAVDFMRQHDLEALVATSPVSITYFSDYSCWVDPLMKEYMVKPGGSTSLATQSYAVFPLQGEPALVLSPLFAVNASNLWVTDLHIFGSFAEADNSLPATELPEADQAILDLLHESPRVETSIAALTEVLKARNLTRARIGIELEGLSSERREQIVRALPEASIRDCTNLIRLIRTVKSDDELSRLTRAAEINELAAHEALELARPGRAMSDLVQHYRSRVAELGADFDHFAFGVNGLGMATQRSHILAPDDLLYVDFGCIFRGCFSDSGRTLAMHAPAPEMRNRHAALRACIETGVDALRPGAKASATQHLMRQSLTNSGIAGSYPHGHGLGLEIREYPILVSNNDLRIRDDCIDVSSDLPLEAGMVINLESALFLTGVASLHTEQSFVVTDEGSQPLVRQDRSEPFIPSESRSRR